MVDESEIRKVVYGAISDTFKVSVDEIGADTVAADVDGWNSITNTLLFLELEQRLQVELPIEILLDAANVGALCLEIRAFMHRRLTSRSGG